MQQDNKYKLLEETLLKEVDCLMAKAESQGEKTLYNLFKSAVLKKYKNRYDIEVLRGEVEEETVDKSIDFLFNNICVKFRALPNIEDSVKEDVINQAQESLDTWKTIVRQRLIDEGIKVI